MPETRTLKIIWLGFMLSIAIFQVVAFVSQPDLDEPDQQLAITVLLFAAGPALFGLLGVPRLMAHQPAQTAYILRFACFESVAIFGFVASFVSADPAFSIAAAIIAWGLLATSFPTDERYTAWEMRRLSE